MTISDNPIISVIIPVYNVEQYLKRCVDSVVTQTYKNLEIILVDDGSTDGSGRLCDELALSDSRIKVIHQKNAGLSGARNAGLRDYKGEYVCFIDSDDYVHPEYINFMYKLCINNNCKMAICESLATDKSNYKDTSPLLSDCTVYDSHDLLNDFFGPMHCTIAVAWNKMIHRSALCDILFEPGIIHEDEATTFKYIYNAGKIAYTPNQLYYYYSRESSITGIGFSKKNLDILIGYEKRLEFYKEHNETGLYNKECSYYLAAILINYYKTATLLKDPSLKKELRTLYKTAYKTYGGNVPSFSKKLVFFICRFFPLLYGMARKAG